MVQVQLMAGRRIRTLLSYLFSWLMEATKTLVGSGAFWFITWCEIAQLPLLSGKSISSLIQPLSHRHSLFFALSDWKKGKTWFPTDLLFWQVLSELCLKWGWTAGPRKEPPLLCLNLGIKVTQSCHTYSPYIHTFAKTWRFYTVFKLKMVWKRLTEKFDHKRRFTAINMRITL